MKLPNLINKLLDISDVSFPRYMLDLVKNTTRAERISCTVAVLLIITCIILIVYFTVIVQKPFENDDEGMDHFNITYVPTYIFFWISMFLYTLIG